MAFACTDRDQKDLHDFLARILDAHKGGQITKDRAIIVMSHVIVAAATDAPTEFRSCIRLPLQHYALDHLDA